MISLEQVRQLDIRVKKAVSTVKALSAENEALKKRIAELEANLDNLQKEASDRKADEQQLEVSLQGVLDVLDEVDEETAGVEPEAPADNYFIETVDDESPVEESDDENGVATVEETPVEEETQEDSQPGEVPVDAVEAPEIEVEDSSEPAPTIEIVEEREPEKLDVTAFDNGNESPDEDTSRDADEEINLEEDGSEQESSDDDQFQSEFDIF